MLKEPVSFPSFTFEDTSNVQLLSIEEKEVVYGTLSRLESKGNFATAVSKISSALQEEKIEVLVSHSNNFERITFKKGVGVIFPEQFFKIDPISQEMTLNQLLTEVAKIDWGAEPYLAKVPKSKN